MADRPTALLKSALGTARWRWIISSAILVLMLSASAWITIVQSQTDDAVHHSLEQRSDIVSALESARSEFFIASTITVTLLMAQDRSSLTESLNDAVGRETAELETARNLLAALGEGEAVAEIDAYAAERKALSEQFGSFIDSVSPGDGSQASGLVTAAVPLIMPTVDAMLRRLSEIVSAQREKLVIRRETAARDADRITAGLIGFNVLAILLACLTLFTFDHSVIRHLHDLHTRVRAIAGGDLSSRATERGPEEIASLARDFNEMVTIRVHAEEELTKARDDLELRVVQRTTELASANEELSRLAKTDYLTGLMNHRSLQESLAKEIKRSSRHGHHLALLMMDIDGFKLFNDTYGHPEGDRVLRQMAGILKRVFRETDIVGRYGGDEFTVIMPETDREHAIQAARRMLDALSAERVQPRNGKDLPLTASLGLALFPDDTRNKEELIAFADNSLYEAKQTTGPNLVVASERVDSNMGEAHTRFAVLDALVRAVDRKDRYTHRHSLQNAEFAVNLGKVAGMSDGALSALRIAGLLHDVGKIGVPDSILQKPGLLTDGEQRTMQEHVTLSNLIVHGVPNLSDVSDAVYSHHERWDGTGYPRSLKGEDIPLGGRIMAIVDAYSAMILDRPYRKALSHDDAVAELGRNAGSQFDPGLVELFIASLDAREQEAA